MKHSNSFLIGAVGAPAQDSGSAGQCTSPVQGHPGNPTSKLSLKHLLREWQMEKHQPGEADVLSLWLIWYKIGAGSLVRSVQDTSLSAIAPQKRSQRTSQGCCLPLAMTALCPQEMLPYQHTSQPEEFPLCNLEVQISMEGTKFYKNFRPSQRAKEKW